MYSMRKIEIKVEKTIKYLKDFEMDGNPFELPNGVLAKDVAGCGATTLALEDEHRTIICSPRNNILVNKHDQYPETLLVVGGVKVDEVREYIKSTDTPKILVTYDSVYKLLECIEVKTDWRVVVDEFQYLLADSSFKSEVELGFLENLKEFPYVTYLSATPILDKYLEQIEFFKGMDYYKLVWENKETIKVYRQKSARPIDSAIEIIKYYQDENYPSTEVGGQTVYSKECVIFLNSVNNIVNIIKHTGLSADEVNIIVGNSGENDEQIAKLGTGFTRGKIPLRGETHKMFTFCTSTAFAGCDFYSTNASTFVISDCKRLNTTIDISTDLVQIAGRQRLDCNPFRKYLTFIYNVNMKDVPESDFIEYLDNKVNLTNYEIDAKNNVDDVLKAKWIKDTLRLQRIFKYDNSYTMYDESQKRFVFNKLAYISEQYSYDLQMHNYKNGVVIRGQLQDNNFDVTENQTYGKYEEQLKHIIVKESFVDRMKYYCEYKSIKLCFDGAAMVLEQKYPEVKYYYDYLGGQRIKALGYKEKELKNEITANESKNRVHYELCKVINVGDRLTTDEIKNRLRKVYDKLRVTKTVKATDLQNVYGFNIHECKISMDDGIRKNGWEIIGV